MDVGFLHVPGIVLRLLCVLCGLCVRVRNFHAKLAQVAMEDAKWNVPEMSVSRVQRENHLRKRVVSASAHHVPEMRTSLPSR